MIDNGNLMSCGYNIYGQLGLGDVNLVQVLVPNLISFNTNGLELNRTNFLMSDSTFLILTGPFYMTGMELLTTSQLTASTSNIINTNNSSNIGLIVGLVLGIFFLILAIAIIGVLIFKLKKKKKITTYEFDDIAANQPRTKTVDLKNLSLEEIIENVKVKERLGGGIFADVYLGEWNYVKGKNYNQLKMK